MPCSLPLHHQVSALKSAPVLRLQVVDHRFRLAAPVGLGIRAVVVVVRVLGWADILHLDDVAALVAALDRSLAARHEPLDDVGIGGHAGAAHVLLVAEGLDNDGVFEGSFCPRLV
jgi:hypothetical protein